MATLNGTHFENPLYVGDGSFGDPVKGPYAKELQQQRYLPPQGEYWLNLHGHWEPAYVYQGVLMEFTLLGRHSGETERYDLKDAEWWTREPFHPR